MKCYVRSAAGAGSVAVAVSVGAAPLAAGVAGSSTFLAVSVPLFFFLKRPFIFALNPEIGLDTVGSKDMSVSRRVVCVPRMKQEYIQRRVVVGDALKFLECC